MPHKDQDQRREYQKRYKAAHPVEPEKTREYQKKYRAKYHDEILERERARNTPSARRRRRYGLTPERFDSIMEMQGGLCACCKSRAPVDVDHCHKTGHFRGLLCRSCNLGLGMFSDDQNLMVSAIAYLNQATMPIGKRYPQKRSDLGSKKARGEECHSSKLNDEIVRQIRADYAAGGTSYPKLADKYGIHHVHLARVVRRDVWAHVKD